MITLTIYNKQFSLKLKKSLKFETKSLTNQQEIKGHKDKTIKDFSTYQVQFRELDINL